MPGDAASPESLLSRSLKLISEITTSQHASPQSHTTTRSLFTGIGGANNAPSSSASSSLPPTVEALDSLRSNVMTLSDQLFIVSGERTVLQQELASSQRAGLDTARQLEEVRGCLDFLMQHRERKLERRKQRSQWKREKYHHKRLNKAANGLGSGSRRSRKHHRHTNHEEAPNLNTDIQQSQHVRRVSTSQTESGVVVGSARPSLLSPTRSFQERFPSCPSSVASSRSTSSTSSRHSYSSSTISDSNLSSINLSLGGVLGRSTPAINNNSRNTHHHEHAPPTYRSTSQQRLRSAEGREEMLIDMLATKTGSLGPKWSSRAPLLSRNVKQDMQDVMAALNRAKEELSALEGDSLGVRSERVLLTNEIRHANRIIEGLVAEREYMESEIERLLTDKERSESEVEASLRVAKDTIKAQSAFIEELQSELNEAVQGRYNLGEEVRELEEKLATAESVRDTWMASAEASYDEVVRLNRLSEQYSAGVDMASEVNDRLGAEVAENQMLSSAISELHGKLEMTTLQCDESNRRREAVEQQLQNQVASVSETQKDNADLQSRFDALSFEFEESNRYRQELEGKLEEQKGIIKELQGRIDNEGEGSVALRRELEEVREELTRALQPIPKPPTRDVDTEAVVTTSDAHAQAHQHPPSMADAATSRTPAPSLNVSRAPVVVVSRTPSSVAACTHISDDVPTTSRWRDPYEAVPAPAELSISAVQGYPILSSGSSNTNNNHHVDYSRRNQSSSSSPSRLYPPTDESPQYQFYFPDHPAQFDTL